MCDTCGCNVTPGNRHRLAAGGHLHQTSAGSESIEVLESLLKANDEQARHNHQHFGGMEVSEAKRLRELEAEDEVCL